MQAFDSFTKMFSQRAQLAANAEMMAGHTDFSKQLDASRQEDAQLVAAAKKEAQNLERPRLTNLNEDPMLSGVVHHYVSVEKTILIGRKDGDPKDRFFSIQRKMRKQETLSILIQYV